MKIKMVEVARKLGVSKATVSLAVNGKPGVNEKTRQKILQCIEEMQNNDQESQEIKEKEHLSEREKAWREISKHMIKVVMVNHNKQVACDPEFDLWSNVLQTLDKEARKRNYMYGIAYLNDAEENAEEIIHECNSEIVDGVILFGTEMKKSDYAMIRQIKKPLVIYDYEMEDGSCSSICIDNVMAVRLAMNALMKSGVENIKYLATSKKIYNFERRREAFLQELIHHEKMAKRDDIIHLGNSIQEITESVIRYLQENPWPEGIVMENYQVSVGVLTAFHRLGIKVPEEIKLVGIDEVPEYITRDLNLTQIRIPHTERAALAMNLLNKEIQHSWSVKNKIFAIPELIKGDSV